MSEVKPLTDDDLKSVANYVAEQEGGIVTTLIQRTGGYYRDRDCIFCKAHWSAPENMQANLNERIRSPRIPPRSSPPQASKP